MHEIIYVESSTLTSETGCRVRHWCWL